MKNIGALFDRDKEADGIKIEGVDGKHLIIGIELQGTCLKTGDLIGTFQKFCEISRGVFDGGDKIIVGLLLHPANGVMVDPAKGF